MMLDTLKQLMVARAYKQLNPLYFRNVLKEEIQNYVLNYIYNDTTYKELIFTGGTCLRKIYGLPRLSEDLDFDFKKDFTILRFSTDIETYFSSHLQYKNIEIKVAGNNGTVFIKFPLLLQELGIAKSRDEPSLLFVRCDFSKESIGIYETEINNVSTVNFTVFIQSYDLPTLFANKIHAFLTRDYFRGGEQTVPCKGRDVFDIVWFLEQSKRLQFQLTPNWARLKRVFPDKDISQIIEGVIEKAQTIDKMKVYQDIAPFIESEQNARQFSEHYAGIISQDMRKLVVTRF